MIEIMHSTRKLSLSNYKGKLIHCPNCGKVRLKPYAYENGEIESPVLGRCQREVKCNYHLKPSEYFKSKGENFINQKTFAPPKVLETYFLNSEIARKFIANYRSSVLFQFLQKTGIDYSGIFEKYLVGATKYGQTIFFQFDGAKFRTGKIITYEQNGHRSKQYLPTWVHKKLGDYNDTTHQLNQCFFGRHLLDSSEVVCLVESEKTALICAPIFQNAVWMATGGRTQMSIARLSELSKKRVLVFPDDDSVVEWSEKIKMFPNFELHDLSKFNTSGKKGADLADLLLEMGEKTRKEIYLHLINII